jgi:L-seryl-tRNA(Ser) seleniumtransferase
MEPVDSKGGTMANRRTFLQLISQAPLVGGFFARDAFAAPKAKTPDYLADLGVKPFINAAGTYTMLTASLMPPEVMEAMSYASRRFYRLGDVQDAVGKRIAELLGAEAAMVTSGAAGALTCGTAACLTGDDPMKIQQLPDLTGLKNEVLIQKAHRYGYEHAVRATGVRMVEVESAAELEKAAGARTAMMLFLNDADPRGQIHAADWVGLGKKLSIPTFNDASADVPPVENLSKYVKMGFDLVTFSGGKGLCGPQSAGLLVGRKDLVAAARRNTSPYGDCLARGMKVNKEEMLGMLVALELFMKRDHAAEGREWDRRCGIIASAARKFLSVTTEVVVPPIANHVPHLFIRWDESRLKIGPREVMQRLRAGEPAIEPCPMTDDKQLVFTVWMLQPGEAEVVARALTKILAKPA